MLFPSAADNEALFDIGLWSLGSSFVPSWLASISDAVSSDIIACFFPRADSQNVTNKLITPCILRHKIFPKENSVKFQNISELTI